MKSEFERGPKAGILSCAGIALAAGLALAIAAPRTMRAQAPAATPAAQSAPSGATAAAAAPQTGAPAATVKTAGDAYMNVTVLKDAPADQLISAMQFMAASLGVHCTFCHVLPNFEDDSKRPKNTAREMIQMEMDINKTNFQGRLVVTCNTCHRGAAHPVGTPETPEEGQMAMASMPAMGPGAGGGPGAAGGPGAPGGPGMRPGAAGPAAAPVTPAPTADQIIDKYTQAIGGADAIAKLASFKAEGTVTVEGGGGGIQSGVLEIMQEAPNKRWISLGGINPVAAEGTDGTDFWMQDAQGQVHDLEGTLLVEMKRAATIGWVLDIRKNFSRLTVAPNMGQIGDHKVYVVMGVPAGGGPREQLMFDPDSGLLLRYSFVAPSPIGNDPIEGDFSDYRDAGGGLKLPFTVRKAEPGSVTTERLTKIEINARVDESKFTRPAAAAAPKTAAPAPAATPAPATPPAKP